MDLKISVRLYRPADFVRAVVEATTETETLKEAFDIVNKEFENRVGSPKFSSYGAFRVTKCRYHKRLRESRDTKGQLNLFL